MTKQDKVSNSKKRPLEEPQKLVQMGLAFSCISFIILPFLGFLGVGVCGRALVLNRKDNNKNIFRLAILGIVIGVVSVVLNYIIFT